MFKYTIPLLLQKLLPVFTWKVKTSEKILYLTFDDGPHPEVTLWVLAILKKYNAKATFFCIGENVQIYPDIFQNLFTDGHSVGNHTFNHLNALTTNSHNYLENIEKCSEFVKSDLFRPPYGRLAISHTLALRKKYKIILWNRLSRDYDKNLNIEECISEMKKNPLSGSIFVFHDSQKAFENLKHILEPLLIYFSELGYGFKAITNSDLSK